MFKRKVLPLVILISVLLCSFTVAYADEDIYVEDFTGHPLAVPPAGFTVISNPGSGVADVFVMDVDPVLHEAINFTLFALEPNTFADIFRPVVINEPLVTFEFVYMGSVLPPDMSGSSFIVLDDGEDYCGIRFAYDDGMAYVWHDGPDIPIGPYVQNAYNAYRLEIDYSTHTFDVYYNGFAIFGAQGLTMNPFGASSQLVISSTLNSTPFVHSDSYDNISITSTTPEPAPNPRTGDSTDYGWLVVVIMLVMIAGGVLTKKFAVK